MPSRNYIYLGIAGNVGDMDTHSPEKIAEGNMSYEFAEAMFPKCVASCECIESGASVCLARD